MTEHLFSTISWYKQHCLYEVSDEKLHVLDTASVLYFDYNAVTRDFPWLCSDSKQKTIKNILDWATSMAAVSKGHIDGSNVNTPLSRNGKTINAIRPPRYGRASIIDSAKAMGMNDISEEQRRLCDIKGCGIRPNLVAQAAPHSTGLLTLIEAVTEIINRKIIERIFDISDLPHKCLPYYAVVDMGFRHDGVYEKSARTALIIRRAHFRPKDNDEISKYNSSKHKDISYIEKLLNLFCITSTASDVALEVYSDHDQWRCRFAGQELDWLTHEHLLTLAEEYQLSFPNQIRLTNIQMADEKHDEERQSRLLVDFSQYCFTDFSAPYYEVTPAVDKPLNFGNVRWIGGDHGSSSIHFQNLKNNRFFNKSRLDPDVLLHFENLSPSKEYSKVVKFGHEIVASLSKGNADSSEIDQRISEFIDLAFDCRLSS
ncbi:hypothetical protein [Pseudovibrio sp. Ad26]|uniref:hypothetical protein n=1 Tax=Pseudovibrio sp. Ad26 TaxID=989410 RepID=UPI0007AEB0EE|nr:hypothetical protein [Pseudovibrio sp. Ad26]KZL07816.1 hypothetical protein PsAD26_03455 [Pseudovibrio sp. Ad26]